MNRVEYLDILKDYLTGYKISEEEMDDILRDIDEMIEEGISSGKDEIEIINDLGSPKKMLEETLQNFDGNKSSKSNILNKGLGIAEIKKEELSKKIIKNDDGKNLMGCLKSIIKRAIKIFGGIFLGLFGLSGAIATTSLAIIACMAVVISFYMFSVYVPIGIGCLFATMFFVGASFVGFECTHGVLLTAVYTLTGCKKTSKDSDLKSNEENILVDEAECLEEK